MQTTTSAKTTAPTKQPSQPQPARKAPHLKVRTHLRAGDRLFDSQNGAAGW